MDSVPHSASNTREATRATMGIAEGPAASLTTTERHHRRASERLLYNTGL